MSTALRLRFRAGVTSQTLGSGVTVFVHRGPASVYAAARPFLPPSHIVLQPFAMVSDGGVRTCVPKRLYDAFTAAFSEEYLGSLYTLGSCGSPYTNWVYNYSGRRADNLIRAVAAAVPASRLRLFPFWVRPS